MALAILLWLYGISTTVFLFSIWGRAVAADTALLSDAATRAAESELVTSRVESWFQDVLAGTGLGESSSGLSEMIAALPEVRSATADLAGNLVRAVAEPADGPVVVDVAEAYRPTVPAVTAALATSGVPVGEEQVEAVVEELEPIVLEASSQRPPVGPRSGAARSLTVATLAALGGMVVSGGGSLAVAGERRAMFRTLLNRLAVSAFTYFIFFQVSSWVLDPRGGRATIRGGLSDLVGSKLWIPAAVAAVAASSGWLVRRRHRHVEPPGPRRPRQ